MRYLACGVLVVVAVLCCRFAFTPPPPRPARAVVIAPPPVPTDASIEQMKREIDEYNRCGTGPLALEQERNDLIIREAIISHFGRDPGRKTHTMRTPKKNHACR